MLLLTVCVHPDTRNVMSILTYGHMDIWDEYGFGVPILTHPQPGPPQAHLIPTPNDSLLGSSKPVEYTLSVSRFPAAFTVTTHNDQVASRNLKDVALF